MLVACATASRLAATASCPGVVYGGTEVPPQLPSTPTVRPAAAAGVRWEPDCAHMLARSTSPNAASQRSAPAMATRRSGRARAQKHKATEQREGEGEEIV